MPAMRSLLASLSLPLPLPDIGRTFAANVAAPLFRSLFRLPTLATPAKKVVYRFVGVAAWLFSLAFVWK